MWIKKRPGIFVAQQTKRRKRVESNMGNCCVRRRLVGKFRLSGRCLSLPFLLHVLQTVPTLPPRFFFLSWLRRRHPHLLVGSTHPPFTSLHISYWGHVCTRPFCFEVSSAIKTFFFCFSREEQHTQTNNGRILVAKERKTLLFILEGPCLPSCLLPPAGKIHY